MVGGYGNNVLQNYVLNIWRGIKNTGEMLCGISPVW